MLLPSRFLRSFVDVEDLLASSTGFQRLSFWKVLLVDIGEVTDSIGCVGLVSHGSEGVVFPFVSRDGLCVVKKEAKFKKRPGDEDGIADVNFVCSGPLLITLRIRRSHRTQWGLLGVRD